MIAQDSIEGLKARLDIVDIVGSYIELKRAGATFKAPCPFHEEKTPSFVVNARRQSYHCFGCGAHGDAIRFVMEYEKLSYPEAIEKLATTLNYTLHYTEDTPHKKRSNLLENLNHWYQKRLLNVPDALHYLHERGVFSSTIERFGIGYAGGSAQTIEFVRRNAFGEDEAIEQGALGRGEDGRVFARFIERITFPIHSPSGVIVGFGGRTISNHPAKYVNSPQSAIFNKSRLLYAYHHARESIHRRREILITEGYLDVIMLHQAGFTHAVATLGTALTNDHLPLLRKAEPKVFLAYDGDKAGRAAALKASRLLSSGGFDGGVILFEGGRDPADMIQQGLIAELNALLHHPKEFITFVLDEILSLYDLRHPKSKEEAMHACIEYLKTLSPLLQEAYHLPLASRLGIPPNLVRLQSPTSTSVPLQLGHYDPWELGLIKTLIDQPQNIARVCEFITPTMLMYHAEEFQSLLYRRDDPRLSAIAMDERIIPFENLDKEMQVFLQIHYHRQIKHLRTRNDLSFGEQMFRIRQLREVIERLKRGELIAHQE